MQAARMDAAGSKPSEIADELGVSRQSVSNWRAKKEYKRVREVLVSAVNERCIEGASVLRTKSGEALLLAIDQVTRALKEETDPDTIQKLGKLALDLWRTTCAQTGLVETTGHKVEMGSAELDALDGVMSRLED